MELWRVCGVRSVAPVHAAGRDNRQRRAPRLQLADLDGTRVCAKQQRLKPWLLLPMRSAKCRQRTDKGVEHTSIKQSITAVCKRRASRRCARAAAAARAPVAPAMRLAKCRQHGDEGVEHTSLENIHCSMLASGIVPPAGGSEPRSCAYAAAAVQNLIVPALR